MEIVSFPRRMQLRDGRRQRAGGAPDMLIRDARQKDLGFVADSFFQSAHKGFAYRNIRHSAYEERMPAVIERLLSRSEVHIACEKSDEHEIIAWMAAERLADALCIHYAYTQQLFRNFGLQRQLFGSFVAKGSDPPRVIYTHCNEASVAIGAHHGFESNHLLVLEDKKGSEP